MIRHSKEWKPNRCSQSNFIQRGFKSYGKCITTAPFKIIIIIVTLGILGVGIYGNILLRQEFDPTWFLPADTYLSKWFTANKKYFPFGKCLHTTDYGRPERKKPSLHGRKFNPNPKFLGTAEAYFVCHIGPSFQISLIYAFIGCP